MKNIDIRGGFCLFAVLLFCLMPEKLRLPYVLSAASHEAGHILTAILLGGRLQRLELGFADVKLELANLNYGQELLCALAGPAVHFALAGIFRACPLFAACCLLLGAYNLVPVLPLDGGRAVENALLLRRDPDWVQRFCRILGCIVCALLLLFGTVQVLRRENALFLAAAISITVRWAQNAVAF